MTPERIFAIANALALAAWLALLFFPSWRLMTNTVAPIAIPCLLAVAYLIILAFFFDPSGFTKFSTLAGLASLQSNSWLMLAGWLHYLAFDLFVGTWEVRTARRDGIPHLVIVPSLVLTFMAGPMGLLVFVFTRYLFRNRLSVEG